MKKSTHVRIEQQKSISHVMSDFRDPCHSINSLSAKARGILKVATIDSFIIYPKRNNFPSLNKAEREK